MNTQIQPKTLVRLLTVVVIACIVSTLLAGPRADAASDGYGVTAATVSAASAIAEGASDINLPTLK